MHGRLPIPVQTPAAPPIAAKPYESPAKTPPAHVVASVKKHKKFQRADRA